MMAQHLADAVLLLHFSIVIFVVGGLLVVVVGNWLRWGWVNAWPFRLAHGAAIAFVVVQAWLGQTCPLTMLESRLRLQAGSSAYSKSFIEDWVHSMLYFTAPSWVFTLAYTVFAMAVALAWWFYPPGRTVAVRSKPG